MPPGHLRVVGDAQAGRGGASDDELAPGLDRRLLPTHPHVEYVGHGTLLTAGTGAGRLKHMDPADDLGGDHVRDVSVGLGPAGRLLGPADIRALAARLDVRPTKTLGQNFLHDANTIRRIVRTAELDDGERVLEVGPGLGSLTLGLLAGGHPVTAVEIDPVLAAALPATVAERQPAGELTVVTADALRLADLPGPAPTALVANLPYNVAVPVVLHLLAVLPQLRRGLVMVQSEVADRLAAPPGSKVYGVPSAKLAWYAASTRAGAVPPSVFWPVPKVDSGTGAAGAPRPAADHGPARRGLRRGRRRVRAASQDPAGRPRRLGGFALGRRDGAACRRASTPRRGARPSTSRHSPGSRSIGRPGKHDDSGSTRPRGPRSLGMRLRLAYSLPNILDLWRAP